MGEGSNKLTMVLALGVMIVSVSFMFQADDDPPTEQITKQTNRAASADFDYQAVFRSEFVEEDSVVATWDERAEAAMWKVPKGVKVVSKMRNALYMFAGPGCDLAPPPGVTKPGQGQVKRDTGIAASR